MQNKHLALIAAACIVALLYYRSKAATAAPVAAKAPAAAE
jgi:hypothetical protein